jgi:hypothetical protein
LFEDGLVPVASLSELASITRNGDDCKNGDYFIYI